MKSTGYILLGFFSILTITPTATISEIPLEKKNIYTINSLDKYEERIEIKKDSLEILKDEVIKLQREIGVRK